MKKLLSILTIPILLFCMTACHDMEKGMELNGNRFIELAGYSYNINSSTYSIVEDTQTGVLYLRGDSHVGLVSFYKNATTVMTIEDLK